MKSQNNNKIDGGRYCVDKKGNEVREIVEYKTV